MREHFDAAVAFVLRIEQEHSTDAKDPGGDTWWGLARRFNPEIEPWPPTRETAIEVYHRKYWLNVGCDELPAQVGILVFDAAVNQGPETAVELLQAEVGTKQDGKLGPKTLAAVQKRNHDDLASQYAARRGARYAVTAHADRYILGWMRRLFDCYRLALVIG